MSVHATAVVAESAELGAGVEIGPYCVIGPRVVLGPGCRLHSHVVIDGDTHLGARCTVYPHAVLGMTPQDKKLSNAVSHQSLLRIGDDNQIREFCTIHGGTEFGGGVTKVGSNNMLLAACHIGHDATVGNHVVFTNGALAAGHTEVHDHVILGAITGIHQFSRVGSYAMIGAGAMMSKDAPPCALVQGDRARLVGINTIGLKRAGFEPVRIAKIKRAYRGLFWRPGTLPERLAAVRRMACDDEMIRQILDFASTSTRGLVMPTERFGEHGSSAED